MHSREPGAPATNELWTGHDRRTGPYRRILWALLGAGVATFAQLYSPQGILPKLASELNVDASRASLTISAATIGLAISVLPWSLIADRFGRVRTMRLALIAATGLGLLMPWSPTFETLMVIRVLEGVALGGIPAIAVVYLSEEVDRRHAAVAAATYVSGTTIGGLVGRLLAAPIADAAGWRLGTFSVAVLAAIAASAFFALTPRPRGFQQHHTTMRSMVRTIRGHMRTPRLLVLYIQGFLLMGGFVAIYNYLTFHLETHPFSLSVAATSLLFLAYLAGTVSSRLAGGIVARFGRHTVLLFAVTVMAAGALMTVSRLLAIIIIGLVVMTAGFFAAHAVASGWVGMRAEHGRAQATSLYNLWYYAGSSILGYIGGVVFVAAGWTVLIFSIVALLALTGLLAVWDRRSAA